MPHILHIIPTLRIGGVETTVVRTLPYFKHFGYTQSLCCLTARGPLEEQALNAGVDVVQLKRSGRYDFSLIPQLVRLIKELTKRTDKLIIRTHGFTAGSWGRVAGLLAGQRNLVQQEHGTAWTNTAAMRLVDRFLAPFTPIWLTISTASAIILSQTAGIPKSKFRHIDYGVETRYADEHANHPQTALRSMLAIPQDAYLILSVGRMDNPKGLPHLWQAIQLVWQNLPSAQSSKIHYVHIGGGFLEQQLRSYASQLGILDDPRFHLPGSLPEAARYTPEADLFVQSSVHEAFGVATVEAAFAKVPVIASAVDGLAEVIEHMNTGYLVPCLIPPQTWQVKGATLVPRYVVDGYTQLLRKPLAPEPQVLADTIVHALQNPREALSLAHKAYSILYPKHQMRRYTAELHQIFQAL